MEQIWLDVLGFEGLYKVSNDGLVKNCKTEKILKFSQTYNGYLRVKLYKRIDGKRFNKTFMVHRLVAVAFIANLENKKEVNHIDGCKTNNCVENLEWVTSHENMAHSVRTGLRDMTCCTKATKKKVMQFDKDGNFIKLWESMSEAARTLSIPVSNISHNCAGRINHAGGYIWSLDC